MSDPDLEKLELTSSPMNTHQESLLIPKPMNLLLGLWLDFPLFAFLVHEHSPPQTFNGLTSSLLYFAFHELQLLAIPKWTQFVVIETCLNLTYSGWQAVLPDLGIQLIACSIYGTSSTNLSRQESKYIYIPT